MTSIPTRRDFLGGLAAGAAACALPGAGAQPTIRKKPNILFILVDDMGYSDLGCYGNTFCDTPNIDRLAQQGMRFTNGYASAPICSASRAGFLTGRSPARLGFEFVTKPEEDYAADWAKRYVGKKLIPPLFTLNLSLEERTIAEEMHAAGYTTGITGKWHVSAHHEHYLGWSPTHGPRKQGFDWGQEEFGAHPYGYAKSEKGKFGPYNEGAYEPDALTDNAIGFLKENRDNPFFLLVSHYYVHVPLGTKCKWLLDKYQSRAEGKYNKKRALYGAFVETMDHYVGQLLDALDELGLADDTLVILTSDNGGHPEFAFNAPLRGSKWNLYEGGIRVPLIARWPGRVAADTTCDPPVVSTDFMPTFCELTGEQPCADTTLDGANVLPLLRGEKPGAFEDRSLYWHFPYYHPERTFDQCKAAIGIEDGYVSQTRPMSALRQGCYKLIYFYETETCELYDLAEDIGEQHNLAEKMPAKARAMKQNLFAYLETSNARLPKPNVTSKDTPIQ